MLQIRGVDAELLQDIQLRVEVELDEVIVPPRVRRVPALHHRGEPRRPAKNSHGRGNRVGEQIQNASGEPLRFNHRSGVDARPTAALEPDFRPGMRVGLTHREVAATRVPFAAQIACDHVRRHTARTHQGYEGRREVLAESAAGREKKLIHRVAAEAGRRQRVLESSRAQELQHRRDECAVGSGAGTQLQGKRFRTRVAVSMPRGIPLSFEPRKLRRRAHCCIGDRRIGCYLHYGQRSDQFIVAREVHLGIRLRVGCVESEPPALRARLEGYAVSVRGPQVLKPPLTKEGIEIPAPGVTVEIVQDEAAPIALLRRRSRSVEASAKRDVIG